MQEIDIDAFWESLGEKLEDIGEAALLKKLLEQSFDKKFIEKSRLQADEEKYKSDNFETPKNSLIDYLTDSQFSDIKLLHPKNGNVYK